MKTNHIDGRILYKYLKKNIILKEFLQNVVKAHSFVIPKIPSGRNEILKLLDIYCNFDCGFTWVHTKEGSEYWLQHSINFNRFRKKYIK